MIGHSFPWLIMLCCILVISIDNSTPSNHELSEELRFIHQEIGSLRDENHNQNLEIALLKSRIGSSDDQSRHHRSERHVRRLPPHLFFGKLNNEIEQQKQLNHRRYEQPTNCSDLSILGYILNGFYLVQSNESNDNNQETKVETVFCAFNQPEGTFNPSLIEKRNISRRDTTKYGSSVIKIFNATMSTDWNYGGGYNEQIPFDVAHLNLEEAFNTKTGVFTVQKSGLHLFVLRSTIYFPDLIFLYDTHKYDSLINIRFIKNGNYLFDDVYDGHIYDGGKHLYVNFNKVVAAIRGDTVTVKIYSNKKSLDFMSSNAYFTGYYLTDERVLV